MKETAAGAPGPDKPGSEQRVSMEPGPQQRRGGGPGGKRGQTAPHELARRIVGASALSLALLTAGTAVGLYAVYNRLDHNIKTVDIGLPSIGATTATNSKVKDGPLNILLIGSDSRAGDNAVYGADSGARSDTTMLLHVASDRKTATVASIPRDSMVQIPSCDLANGKTSTARLNMFNSAFSTGGAACTVKTVTALTGIPIDHVMVVDFTGFKTIVDAVGGVTVHLDQAVADPDSHLNLPAGDSVVTGDQALAFVRARHGLGDGSDIGRMQRQQEFLNAVLDKLSSDGVLSDPSKLFKVLDAATTSLTTDASLGSLSALTSLAGDLKTVPRTGITYLTVPWQVYAPDPNRLEFAPASVTLFEALRDDRPVPVSISATLGS